jgi:hypothetical protein
MGSGSVWSDGQDRVPGTANLRIGIRINANLRLANFNANPAIGRPGVPTRKLSHHQKMDRVSSL